MAGPTELRLTHLGVDLDVGAGVWVYAQEQHWISVYHSQYMCGDGHMHLWRDERARGHCTSMWHHRAVGRASNSTPRTGPVVSIHICG